MNLPVVIAAVVLAVAAVLLALISGAEASIIAISRRRVRAGQPSGTSQLLQSYIRERHAILSALSVGAAAMVVIGTAALALVMLHGRPVTPLAVAVLAVVAIIGVALTRQTARAIATLSPEAFGVTLAAPTRLVQVVFGPLVWLSTMPVGVVLRAFGRSAIPTQPDPAEELLAVLEAPADDNDELQEERRMMRGVLEMSEQTVRELMSPRMDITAVSTEASIGDVLKVVTESGFSRIPVYEESIDRIAGVVYAKDLLAYLLTGEVQPRLKEIARPPYFVPETKRASDLLSDMRRDHVHLAVVLDEYGGTAGVVTVEDLLEEIVGEITDEYDTEEVDVQHLPSGEVIVDASLPLDELNELFNVEIEDDDFDTVGGLVFSRLGRLAVPGDEIDIPEYALRLRVLSVLGRRIKKVRIERLASVREPAPAE